jgi:Resolvase, N terminal domain
METLEAQERELRGAGCDKIFAEQVSSAVQREQLELAMNYVREGDTFTVTKLDRLAKSVGDLLEIVARLGHGRGDGQAHAGGYRRRGAGGAGGHAGAAAGGHRQGQGAGPL